MPNLNLYLDIELDKKIIQKAKEKGLGKIDFIISILQEECKK